MSKPQAMMFYPEAWKGSPSVAAMGPVARSGYFELLCSMWLSGGSLPDDERILQANSRLNPKEWKESAALIRAEFATTPDGRITQRRLSEEYSRTVELQDRRRKGGQKGARQRWQSNGSPIGLPNRSPNGTPNAEPMQTETETKTYVNSANSQDPPTPLSASDWAPWTDAEAARDAILAAYPNKSDQWHARSWWQNWITEAVDAPRVARTMLMSAQFLAANCPAHKVQFLPSARNFLAGRWSDDWGAVIGAWTAKEGGGGKMAEAMLAIQAAGRAG